MLFTPQPNNSNDPKRREEFLTKTAAPDVVFLHCRIPASLHRRLKYRALEQNTSIANIVSDLLDLHLDDHQL